MGTQSDDSFSFLFDELVHFQAYVQLKRRGVDVEHIGNTSMRGCSDLAVLDFAANAGRIVLTRNYRDFAPLVESFSSQGRSFPGVLFIASSVPQSDAGAHVAALEHWIASNSNSMRMNPVANTFAWLNRPLVG